MNNAVEIASDFVDTNPVTELLVQLSNSESADDVRVALDVFDAETEM
jgi:hypothetical protein